jgi:ABC-type cobalamin transport system ATPase subunit
MTISLSLQEIHLSKRLHSVSLEAREGAFIHLLGPNGAGKSSLLSTISGLTKPDSGEVIINEKKLHSYDLNKLSHFRVMLEQSHHSTFSITVKESLSFSQGSFLLPSQLEVALEINSFLERPINTLSGGEQRRVHIARTLMPVWPVLACGSGLVLLDEPFQGLDFKHQHMLCKLLSELSKMGNLVIVSQHDLNLCERYADSVWLMQGGRLIEIGDTSVVLTSETIGNIFECSINLAIDENGHRYFSSSL